MSIFNHLFDFYIHGFNKMTEWIHSIWFTVMAILIFINHLHPVYILNPISSSGDDGANYFIKSSTNP